jgi:uncharacterized protein YcbK (DUF882 family)
MGDISANFSRIEFACNCGCGFDTVDSDTLETLEHIREHFNASVVINSGCRCANWNKQCGGEPNSYHLQARAADIAVAGVPPSKVAEWVENGPLKGRGGVGRYNTFTHVDTRSNGPARWSG